MAIELVRCRACGCVASRPRVLPAVAEGRVANEVLRILCPGCDAILGVMTGLAGWHGGEVDLFMLRFHGEAERGEFWGEIWSFLDGTYMEGVEESEISQIFRGVI